MRKIIKGFTNNSYGIDVAKLAGIDDRIINRAKDILTIIEKENEGISIDLNKEFIREEKSNPEVENFINKLREINILELSPMEAFNLLDEIVKQSKELK